MYSSNYNTKDALKGLRMFFSGVASLDAKPRLGWNWIMGAFTKSGHLSQITYEPSIQNSLEQGCLYSTDVSRLWVKTNFERQFHHPNKSWSQNQSWGWGPSHPANEFWHWHKGGRCRPVFTLIMKQHPNTWFYSISSILVSICLLLNLPKAVWLNLQSPGHSSVVKASILTDFCPAFLSYS